MRARQNGGMSERQDRKAEGGRRVRSAARWACVVVLLALPSLSGLPDASALHAQQPVSRLKGRVLTERGERIADAEVRAEAFYGSAAGTFAGQRTFTTRTNAKGEWSIIGIAPGVWIFEAHASGFLPETVVLPNRLVTASSPNAAGQMFLWDLVLKPVAAGEEPRRAALVEAAKAARDGRAADAEALLLKVPEDADAEYLAGAGRVALVARRPEVARALFMRALELDPASYRAALGIASVFLVQRDFDSASRAFDAARNRTHDKDEQKYLSAAIGDLATIRVR
jgi:tetratricopeptide (TPR) repeat protein